jgi:plasmid stabilization system protein ParE
VPEQTARRLIVDVGAEREARDAFLWYFDRNPDAALAFDAEIERAFSAIAEAPLSAPEIEPGVRRVLLSRFPYAVLYAVEPDSIVVLAFAHTRRAPGYWRDR